MITRLMFMIVFAQGLTMAQDQTITDLLPVLLEAFPAIDLVFAASIYVVAPLVNTTVAWIIQRYKNARGEKPHNFLIHAISFSVSMVYSFASHQVGQVEQGFLDLGMFWSVVVYAGVLFLRAGGWIDLKKGGGKGE